MNIEDYVQAKHEERCPGEYETIGWSPVDGWEMKCFYCEDTYNVKTTDSQDD